MTAPFKWTGEDALAASAIAVALTQLHHVEHAKAVIESAVEVELREPRATDAWRFFQAAKVLPFSELRASARELAVKIGNAVMHVEVIDGLMIEVGSSTAIALVRSDFPRPLGAALPFDGEVSRAGGEDSI
jgi:hypothetical protein